MFIQEYFIIQNQNQYIVQQNKTKGGAGSLGMDAGDWRRILVSNKYGTVGCDCRETIFSKTICIEMVVPSSSLDGKVTSFLERFGLQNSSI